MRYIPHYDNMYSATEDGRIWSHRSFKYLKHSLDSYGYSVVSLCRLIGVKKVCKVHRLVALCYLGASHLQVNHINGVKTDNSLSNLEYVTEEQNSKHAHELGLKRRTSDGRYN